MHRTTRTITLVLVGSGLILHGCADDDRGEGTSTTQRSSAVYYGGAGYYRTSPSGAAGDHSSGSSFHGNNTVRGGFGSHISSGSS